MQNKSGLLKKCIPLCFVLVMVAVDQLTKLMIVWWLPKDQTHITVIPGLIDFVFTENPGAAFGLFADHRWVFMTLTAVTLVVLLGLYWFRGVHTRLAVAAVMMIIAGGIGNMIDRIVRGVVIDFINFSFITFPVFNIADCLVVIGCGMLIVHLILDSIRESNNKREDASKGERS